MFGFAGPFIQGYCTLNYVVHALTTSGIGHVEGLDISVVRKTYTGSDIEIRHTDDRFEVLDPRRKLAAVGHWSAV